MSLLDKPALALKLDRVLGLSSQSQSTFCSSPSGDLFYAAGCFVVKYNPEENKQKGFYKLSKAVSSVAITEDGQFLAIGERGQSPTTTVWSVDKFEKLATLSGHKHGIGCMAFAPDGRYLVTVGFKLDRQLIVWDWKSGAKLSTQRLGNKVHSISFHNSGDYFVTAGDRHLKWWTIVEVLEGESISIEGKAASIVEAQRNSVFMDAICGVDSTDTAVYCTTSTGMLCMFGEHKTMDKWVQLESSSSFSLELFPGDGTPGILAVGCANGIIRCFDPRNLAYIATVPLPAPLLGALPRPNAESAQGKESASRNALYAACYAVRRVPGTRASPIPKLAAIYADRSLFVWDISDIYSIAKYRSFMFHRACIWDIQFIESSGQQSNNEDNSPAAQAPLPKGSFVTCSADNTVRFWNVDPRMQRLSKYRSIHSREMLHGIDLLAGLNLEDMPHEDQNTSMATNASQVGSVLNTSSLSATHYLAQQTASVADLDICAGIPDTELPDRPQSQYAPRAMAVHPYAHELACGDKMGTLKVFDIRTMQEVCSTPAHQAEILTLSYSPAMTHNRESNLWSLKGRSESGDDANQEEVVLLASAGRDRLIHIFNASEQYEPIQTLDHHTSSVTITKFTSDGRRFLSCGGDRTMVFSAVDGPVVQRIKSVQTPHGTINGLAVEASNKFAVTSGQDKRLNIWNLQSGKHMRAYKNENIHSELYKSDIDPSGMYIATCGFDKSISIFDFFSGELITQVSGHSELVTGVKFSPDGRYLVSIGGDGCILMWRIADFLVKAMQDRLVELMSSAQRRNLKATAAVQKSHTEGTHSGSNAADLPPPLPTPSFGVPTPPTPPQQALKQPSAGAGTAHDSKSAPAAGAPKNRWAARVEQDHGYELFGKKVDPTVTPERNRNKFTLELSATAAAGLAVAAGSGVKDQQHSESDNLGSTSNRLADELEAADDVILMVDSDEDEGDGSHLFKAPAMSTTDPSSTGESYESDFEDPTNESAGVVSPGGTEPDLDQTQHAIEGMEKSAQDLEHWLENMIRGDGKLDESVAPAAAAPAHCKASAEPSSMPEPKVHQRRVVNKTTGEVSVRPTVARAGGADGDPLDQSLSSAFFQHLRRSGDSHLAREERGDNLLPPPPPNNTEVDAASVEIQTKERKQRETAAAVAQMRERLRVMGILQKTQQGGVEPATPSSSDLSPLPEESASAMQSPVPSKGPSSVSKDDDGYDTASTTSEPDEVRDGNEETGILIRNSQDKASQIVEKINQKSSKYKHILKELEQAKQRAAESYQELLDLRQSLDQSMRQSSAAPVAAAHHKRAAAARRGTNAAGHDDSLNVSMAQVDQLMSQFRSSLTGLSGITAGTVSTGASRKGGFPASTSGTELGFSGSTESRLDLDTVNSLELNSFLERYSDRLVDLVGEKLVKKINNK